MTGVWSAPGVRNRRHVVAALPGAAVRARSVAARRDATVCVAGTTYSRPMTHATTVSGEVYVVVSEDDPVSARSLTAPRGELPAMLTVTDVCPVPVPDGVRGMLWLTGWLAPVADEEVQPARLALADVRIAECLLDIGCGARLLRLHVHDVILSDRAGIVDVPVTDYVCAAPDPLVTDEADALLHLDEHHRDVLVHLVDRLSPSRPRRSYDVRPVALDSFGLGVRVVGDPETLDVRLNFARPLLHIRDLAEALRGLRH